jgi:AcrR family transcriptional regulator
MVLSVMEDPVPYSLTERRQQRTREAIIEAAVTLFDERGFSAVTITEIAQRAEVGRSTFFRYFADKAEVLFADDTLFQAEVAQAAHDAAAPLAPIGTSLSAALSVVQAGLLALSDRISGGRAGLALRARLIEQSPELQARELVKQRGYIMAGIDTLLRNGAKPEIASLAAHLGAGCFAAAHASTLATGRPLSESISVLFGQLLELPVLHPGQQQ